MLFWSLWIIDLITALIVLFYFLVGLSDGSVYAANGGLWLALLAGVTALVAGSLFMKSSGKLALAKVLAAIVAVPAFLCVVFILVAHFGWVNWI